MITASSSLPVWSVSLSTACSTKGAGLSPARKPVHCKVEEISSGRSLRGASPSLRRVMRARTAMACCRGCEMHLEIVGEEGDRLPLRIGYRDVGTGAWPPRGGGLPGVGCCPDCRSSEREKMTCALGPGSGSSGREVSCAAAMETKRKVIPKSLKNLINPTPSVSPRPRAAPLPRVSDSRPPCGAAAQPQRARRLRRRSR